MESDFEHEPYIIEQVPYISKILSQAEYYARLRQTAFATNPEQYNFEPHANVPYVAMMETGYAEAVETLIAVADGTASLFWSNGGGINGSSYPNESVHNASLLFIQLSAQSAATMQDAPEQPMPDIGFVRFYLVTPERILTSLALENDLVTNRSPLSPLFVSAHELISEIRKIYDRLLSKHN